MESCCSPQHIMATPNGLEPSTSSVTGWRANRLHHRAIFGGNNRARTCDLLLVRQMLSQLSYAPIPLLVLRTSATWIIIHTIPHFVKHYFQKFSKNFTACFSMDLLAETRKNRTISICFPMCGHKPSNSFKIFFQKQASGKILRGLQKKTTQLSYTCLSSSAISAGVKR